MSYRFATTNEDYSDYASGRVFYNLPGHPAFPIRLASETFQRCLALRRREGLIAPVHLYDPVCGGAYHLSTLAFFHWEQIRAISASDVDPEAVTIAERNLALLSPEGLTARTRELEEMAAAYGKPSHAKALASAARLKAQLHHFIYDHHPIPTHLFQADALQPGALAARASTRRADVVFSDIPYGRHSAWVTTAPLPGGHDEVWWLLENLRAVLAPGAVVAIAATRHQTVAHERYQQQGKFKIGKRQITLLRNM